MNQAEKFVKLIVKDCTAVYCVRVKTERSLYPAEFSMVLQKHFGVEE
jgi:hypothetical protein